MAIKLAPGVALYALGSVPPPVVQGGLRLAQFPRPGAFGDGSHPTTRLCAGALDVLCRQRLPRAVLDVGTGTGVLARIARARGAVFVAGTDIDPEALACARAHAALDSAAAAIHFGEEAPDHWGARFDLVIANILEDPLRFLAAPLSRALSSTGVLLLSGFTRPQAPSLRVLYERTGVKVVSESHLHEWSLLRLDRA
jgi:ribosomal protein L11 methyltransferase